MGEHVPTSCLDDYTSLGVGGNVVTRVPEKSAGVSTRRRVLVGVVMTASSTMSMELK